MSSTAILIDPTLLDASPATCRHCGDPCDVDGVRTDHGTFCCAGCDAVFTLIRSHGLTAFYTCDVNPGRSQRHSASDAARFASLDDPEIARRLVDVVGNDLARVTLPVPAMHCASCLWLLEQLWRFDSGIQRSEADLLRRTVRVEYRPSVTTLRAVAERLASLGYEPVIEGERRAGQAPHARRELWLRIGVAGFAFGNVMLFSIPRYVNGGPLDHGFQRLFDVLNILFAIPVLLYSASPYFRSAWMALRARSMRLEVPVAIGLVVLFGRSVFDIATGAGEGFLDSFSGLVFFLLIGRLFQEKAFDGIAFDRTVRSFLPLSVCVEHGGERRLTRVEELRVGDVMVLRPHEVVPADAVVLDEDAAIDYAFVSGESTPTAAGRGQPVHAGGRVVGRSVRLVVARDVSQSRLTELWNNPVFARQKVDWLTRLNGQFGFWFTVVTLALAVAGIVSWWPDARMAAQVATAVLIIACPCALTLAAPLTLGTAMGLLGRAGLYVKRPAVALDLSRVDVVVFDKTGTLTAHESESDVVTGGHLAAGGWQLVQRLAAESIHPISRALAGGRTMAGGVRDVREWPGQGIRGVVDGHEVALGSAAFVRAGASGDRATEAASTWASVDGAVGWIALTARERPGIDEVIRALGETCDVWLLSGDHDGERGRWEPHFGSRLLFRQAPEDKLATVQAMHNAGRWVLMIGDGLNDAGALAAADVGIAVSDDTACLVPACDAVVRGDRLAALPHFLRFARRTRPIIVFCLAVSLVYNVFGLWLALTGRLTPLATAVLMPISSLSIVALSVGLTRRAGKSLETAWA